MRREGAPGHVDKVQGMSRKPDASGLGERRLWVV